MGQTSETPLSINVKYLGTRSNPEKSLYEEKKGNPTVIPSYALNHSLTSLAREVMGKVRINDCLAVTKAASVNILNLISYTMVTVLFV